MIVFAVSTQTLANMLDTPRCATRVTVIGLTKSLVKFTSVSLDTTMFTDVRLLVVVRWVLNVNNTKL